MLKYILIIIVGLIVSGIELVSTGNILGENLGIGFIIVTIGLYGLIICVWFKFLKRFYPKANLKRLWTITGYITWIIIVIALCFTGIGAISLISLKHPIVGLIPKDTDK